MTDPWCWYLFANINGVYWWDPWSTIYSSTVRIRHGWGSMHPPVQLMGFRPWTTPARCPQGLFFGGPLNRSWSANRGWTCCHIFSQWCEWWNISVEQNGIGDVFVLTLAIHGKGGANKKVIESTIKSNKTDKTPATDKQKFEDSFNSALNISATNGVNMKKSLNLLTVEELKRTED